MVSIYTMTKKVSPELGRKVLHGLQLKKPADDVELQPDLKYLQFLWTQGQYMFLVPWSTKKQTRFKIFRILLVSVFIPISYKLLSLRSVFFSTLPVSCLIMDIFMFFLSILALMGFCLSQNYYYENWEKMINTVYRTENLLYKGTKFVVKKHRYSWGYIIVHIIFILPHIMQLKRWIKARQYDLTISYIVFRVIHYWATFIAVFIYQWLSFLSRRYDYLKEFIIHRFSQRVIIVRQMVDDLRLAEEIYKNLTTTCDQINKIYSMHLLFIIIMTITLTLHGLSFAIVNLNNNKNVSLDAIAFVTLFFVNMLALIVAYELLQKKSREVIKTCLILQEDMFQSELRSKLSVSIKSMKKLEPKLSAAGFFEIDSQLISSYIGSVFAYLIIILQFNITFV